MPLQPERDDVLATEPCPFTDEVKQAYELFLREIDSDGWEDGGEKDNVKLDSKPLPGIGDSALPLTRGTCIIENATTDKIVPLVQVPGIRKLWDPRFESAWIIRRFTPLGYEFYSLGNSPPGLGWFINPRDLAGMSQIYIAGNPDGQPGKNEEVVIIQVSIVDKERCSEVRGRTRMKLSLSGWRLTPQGNDVKATYMVKVSLGGSLPSSAVATVLKDLPTLVGKLRNTYYEYGYPPYILHDPNSQTHSIQQTEHFHFGRSKSGVHEPVPNDKHWHLHMIGKRDGHFQIRYDTKTMYASEGGVHVTTYGEGKAGVSIVDDGQGVIGVRVAEAADGKRFEMVVHPIGTKVITRNS